MNEVGLEETEVTRGKMRRWYLRGAREEEEEEEDKTTTTTTKKNRNIKIWT